MRWRGCSPHTAPRVFKHLRAGCASSNGIPFAMSDSFTGSLPIVQMGSVNTFQNNELNRLPSIGHDSCIGTPRKPGSTIWKGLVRHHGLDLVDRLGVPGGRLRRHAACRVGRARAQGEGTRLAIPELLRSSFPMSKNEGPGPVGPGELMADIASPSNARSAAHLGAHLAQLQGRGIR